MKSINGLPDIPDGYEFVPKVFEHPRLPKGAKYCESGDDRWHDASGFFPKKNLIYIVPVDAVEYIEPPKPQREPLDKNDWEGGVWWVREDSDSPSQLVTFLGDTVLGLGGGAMRSYSFFMDDGWERSPDLKTFYPCFKNWEDHV